jgi:hypothetical protein
MRARAAQQPRTLVLLRARDLLLDILDLLEDSHGAANNGIRNTVKLELQDEEGGLCPIMAERSRFRTHWETVKYYRCSSVECRRHMRRTLSAINLIQRNYTERCDPLP